MMKRLLHVNELFLNRLIIVLNRNISNIDLHAETVAQELLISKSTLNRKLKELGRPSINEFIKEYRLQQAINILSAGYKVREVSSRVGFRSASYFTHCFKTYYHTTPASFGKRLR